MAFSGHRTYTPHKIHNLNTQLNEARLTSSTLDSQLSELEAIT